MVKKYGFSSVSVRFKDANRRNEEICSPGVLRIPSGDGGGICLSFEAGHAIVYPDTDVVHSLKLDDFRVIGDL